MRVFVTPVDLKIPISAAYSNMFELIFAARAK